MARFSIALVIHFLSTPMQGILRHSEDRQNLLHHGPIYQIRKFLPIEIKTTEVTVAKWVVETFPKFGQETKHSGFSGPTRIMQC